MQRPAPALPPSPLAISVLTGFLAAARRACWQARTCPIRRSSSTSSVPSASIICCWSRGPGKCGVAQRPCLLRRTAGSRRHAIPSAAPPRERRQLATYSSALVLETSRPRREPSQSSTRCRLDAFLGAGLLLGGTPWLPPSRYVVRTQRTLDRLPETTAQAACADRLLFTKTDLAMPSPMLRQRLEALNPAASMSLIAVDTVLGVKHQISLFRSDRGCRRAHCGRGQGAQSRAGLRPSLTSAAHAGL